MSLKIRLSRLSLILALLLVAPLAAATATPEEAARLGKDLTPVGGLAAGNAEGSIPAWIGERDFTDALKNFKRADLERIRSTLNGMNLRSEVDQALSAADKGEFKAVSAVFQKVIDRLPPDQKALAKTAEKQLASAIEPVLTLTQANYRQHADKLTEGHLALFAAHPTYKMNIYGGIRNAFYPQEIYAATRANATRVKLEGTDGIKGALLGFPFPIPKHGAEVIWNHKLKFRGTGVRRWNDHAIVKPDGSYKLTQVVENVKFKYANFKQPPPAGNWLMALYLQEVVAPPRVAGQVILVHETADQSTASRAAWLYSPGLARVNRAPDVGYDNPSIGTDGEQFNDQVDTFNGALDRYNWKLLGRKELYIPYNSYMLSMPVLKYRDLFRPLHLNQSLARYELHRVWVVEATLKPGQRHQLKKRVFYVDEDSWAIAAVAGYDNRGQLWKVQESHLITAPFVPTVTGVPELIYDLQSKRYFATSLLNEGEIPDWEIQLDDALFSPASLNRKARAK